MQIYLCFPSVCLLSCSICFTTRLYSEKKKILHVVCCCRHRCRRRRGDSALPVPHPLIFSVHTPFWRSAPPPYKSGLALFLWACVRANSPPRRVWFKAATRPEGATIIWIKWRRAKRPCATRLLKIPTYGSGEGWQIGVLIIQTFHRGRVLSGREEERKKKKNKLLGAIKPPGVEGREILFLWKKKAIREEMCYNFITQLKFCIVLKVNTLKVNSPFRIPPPPPFFFYHHIHSVFIRGALRATLSFSPFFPSCSSVTSPHKNCVFFPLTPRSFQTPRLRFPQGRARRV